METLVVERTATGWQSYTEMPSGQKIGIKDHATKSDAEDRVISLSSWMQVPYRIEFE